MKEQCMRDNGSGAAVLAKVAADMKIPLTTFSSDLIFDGKAGRPYIETDKPSPRCIYGLSKAAAERDVLRHHGSALIIRTSAFFGPWDQYNFAWAVISALAAGRYFEATADEVVSPTFVPDLVNAALDLLIDEECGIWHLSNEGQLSWYDFAQKIAAAGGRDPAFVRPRLTLRDVNTALETEKGIRLPSLECAISRFANGLQ
jgi:dTDP-4-dehydrorhamnose reductase